MCFGGAGGGMTFENKYIHNLLPKVSEEGNCRYTRRL